MSKKKYTQLTKMIDMSSNTFGIHRNDTLFDILNLLLVFGGTETTRIARYNEYEKRWILYDYTDTVCKILDLFDIVYECSEHEVATTTGTICNKRVDVKSRAFLKEVKANYELNKSKYKKR